MNFPFRDIRINRLLAAAILLIVLAGCSLADEPVPAGPIQTGPLPGEDVQETVPIQLPRASNGALIFTARCASCHGAAGAGDGEFAADLEAQGFTLPDFTDPSLARSRSPQEWFTTITLGTIQQGGRMPPWQEELSDAQRWDVTYYLYSLSTPEEELEQGQALYANLCSACHGPDGSVEGLTDPARLVDDSPASIARMLSEEDGEPHDYSDLSEEELWAVTMYVRTLGYDATLMGAAQAPAEATQVAEESTSEDEAETAPELRTSTTVEGLATLPDGAPVPAGSEVTLSGVSVDEAGALSEFLSQTTTTAEDGTFRFDDVAIAEGSSAYIVTVTYEGVEFSNGAMVDPTLPIVRLPITVYEVTSDPSVVKLDTAHVVFREHPDALVVLEVLVFSNTSNSVYLSEEVVRSGQRGSLAIALPPDAYGVQFEEGQLGGRYVEVGDRIYDTTQVLPGERSHAIIVSYVLPFDGSSRDVEIPLDYGAEQITVLVQGEVDVRASGLSEAGVQDIQGEVFDQYVGTQLAPGDTLTLRLSAGGFLGGLPDWVLPALIGLGVALVVGGGAIWVINRRTAEDIDDEDDDRVVPDDQAALLRQIAELDDAYDAGRIDRFEYDTRRAELKARLAELMKP